MKKTHYYIIATIILAGLNVWAWNLNLKIDYQLAWIAFLLVFIDLAIGWFVYTKSEANLYLFFTSALIIELLLIINSLWIQRVAGV
jgi:hypothetical protein